jgi:hypothetical protein
LCRQGIDLPEKDETMIELHGLVNDIGVIEKQMYGFESKYGVLSHEFFQAFSAGELSEFDAYDEYRMEFLEWAALYQARQKLEKEYRRLSARQPAAARIRLLLEAA